MKYTTKQILNLTTNQPFTFEVPDKDIRRFEDQKKMIAAGKAPALGRVEDLTEIFELCLFPTFEEVHKIFFENGYTEDLLTKILKDFGLHEDFIRRFIEDEECIAEIRPWFEGITQDGTRAANTLMIVYNRAKQHFTA